MGSTRLPGKVLEDLGGMPVLEWVVRACRGAGRVDEVIVATSTDPGDDVLVEACADLGVSVVRGSEDDVLSRYVLALDQHPADAVVRITADCPFTDPALVDAVVAAWEADPSLDYVSTVLVRTLPHGLDVELVTAQALRRVAATATDHHRVHVTSAVHTDPDTLLADGVVLHTGCLGDPGHPRHPRGPGPAARGRRRTRDFHPVARRARPVVPGPSRPRGPQRRGPTEDPGRRLMRLLLRCDGGPATGVGHVVRSLALAEEAVRRGHEVSVLGEVSGGLLEGLARAVGPGLRLLGPAESVTDLLRAVPGHDVVHLDHYELPATVAADIAAAAESAGRPRPLVSAVADGVHGVQSADVVIDPTVGAEHRATGARARWLLLGGRFVALRDAVVRAEPAPRRSERLAVLVVMGGTDPGGCAPEVLRALAATGAVLDVTVVASPATAPDLEAAAAAWVHGTVRVTEPVADLPSIMAAADVVISAAGTTAWELCALARPMAVVAAVDNQRPGHDVLVEAGAALGLGGAAQLRDVDALGARLRPLLADPELRRSLAGRAHALVDGRGAWRQVRMLEEAAAAGSVPPVAEWPAVTVRPAIRGDADLLLAWRNDATTRAVSRTTSEVPRADHLAWLETTLARPDRHLLLATVGDEPVGTVRWDDEGAGEWEVSITLAPGARGRGLAGTVLASAERWLVGHLSDRPTALAVVRSDNVASRRLFLRAGYAPDLPSDDSGFERWVRTLR